MPDKPRSPHGHEADMNQKEKVMDELHAREERAQVGVLQFAEEMQAIRGVDNDPDRPPLYPNAGKPDAWKTYCRERWGMSEGHVARIIQARPVLERRSHAPAAHVSVTAAAAVASLPEPVQDAILADAPKRDVVKARAKAARTVAKSYERQELEPDLDEMIQAAAVARPPKPEPKAPPMPDHLKPENLPPRLRPEDHGWAPRTLAGKALLFLWQANEKLEDSLPPTPEDADVMAEKVAKLMNLAPVVLAKLRGESTVSDADLYALMERKS